MQHRNACPLCSNTELEAVHPDTNLKLPAARGEVPAEWVRADFAFCGRCGLISARRLQEQASVAEFYEKFKELEHRDYVTYPLPQEFVDNQMHFAEGLYGSAAPHLEEWAEQGREPSILNIRSECGIVLERFRRGLRTERVYALDHFDTNRRYAREELKLPYVEEFLPGTPQVPSGWPRRYDLVLANHLLTHAFDLHACMEALKGLLEPDGLLLCYNEADHAEALRRPRAYKRGINSFHKQLFDRRSFENVFRASEMALTWLPPLPGLKWAIPHDSMIVIARAGAAPAELLAGHDAYREVFRAWDAQHEEWKPSLKSRVKQGWRSIKQRARSLSAP